MHPALALVGLLAVAPSRMVLNAPEGAPPDAALSWRAWTPGPSEMTAPVLLEEHVGATEPRTLSLRLPPDAGFWTVLVEGEAGGDAWMGVARGAGAASVALMPVPTPLVELEPSPPTAPAPAPPRVRLSWHDSGEVADVAGWQVLRTVGRGEAMLVGEVSGRTSRFVDEPPPGEITWSLRPVLTDGVTGPVGRASEPAWIAPQPIRRDAALSP